MSPAFLSRILHKWLALICGLQFVLWALTGFYMVVMDLDFIHGDSLVRNQRIPIALDQSRVPVAEVARRYPGVSELSLRSVPSFPHPLYELTAGGRKVLVDSATGEQVSPLHADRVRELARSYYAGAGDVVSVRLLERDRPLEIQTRSLPLWRADFDDWLDTSLYIHPDTGALVTRRHRFWRWFDFFWMLHIMDFDTRDDVNNGLLRATTVLGTGAVLSGAWLLYFSFRRRRHSSGRTHP